MLKSLRRNIMMQQAGGLPSDYTPIDFLHANLGQWLVTDIVANAGTRIEFKYEMPNPNISWQCGCGGGSPYRFAVGHDTNFPSYYVGLGSYEYYNFGAEYQSGVMNLVLDAEHKTFTYNGMTYFLDLVNYFTSSIYPIAFFGRNAGMGTVLRNHEANLYPAKIYDYGVLKHDLQPCISPQNLYGVYDIIGRVFFPLVNV